MVARDILTDGSRANARVACALLCLLMQDGKLQRNFGSQKKKPSVRYIIEEETPADLAER
jgi:hypothetical protein